MKKRIVGIDVARALAVFGMIIVNFKMVLGQEGEGWLHSFSGVLDGKAAATFVVLAGVGIAFMTNSSYPNFDKRIGLKILKRAVFLFVIGLSYILIWPADILHFYGIYMMITLLLIKSKPITILLTALAFILVYPILMFALPYDIGWDFSTYEYDGFWTLTGFMRNLFYNGFHPVMPWTAFMLLGLWFGRQDLHNTIFIKKVTWISLSIFLFIKIVSVSLISLLSQSDQGIAAELTQIIGTSPMPPLPFYMVSGSSFALFVISCCILISRKFEGNSIINVLMKVGQLALTFYVAHVVIGMGLVEEVSGIPLGTFDLEFSILYALVFILICITFTIIWTKYKKVGPLEWVLRKLTG